MASGDASRTWFPEMVDALREQWRLEMSPDDLIALAARLDGMLQKIRVERNIQPPMMRCPHCGQRGRSPVMRVSVRTVLFALGRFGLAPSTVVKESDRLWKKHRLANGLDRYGKKDCCDPLRDKEAGCAKGY